MADEMEFDGGGTAAAAAAAEGGAAAARADPAKGSGVQEAHAPQTSGEAAKGGAQAANEPAGARGADGDGDGGARSGRSPSPAAGAAAADGSAAAAADAAASPPGTALAAEDPKEQKAGKQPGKFMAQYKVSCLNCGVQLYIELPPGVVNFQCCQCYAVHKVIQPDPAAAAEENRKRKRKDRKGGPSESRDMPMTPYNKFIREELQSIKEANPSLSHRDAFKQASAKWAQCPENPKVAKDSAKEAAAEVSSAPSASSGAAAAPVASLPAPAAPAAQPAAQPAGIQAVQSAAQPETQSATQPP